MRARISDWAFVSIAVPVAVAFAANAYLLRQIHECHSQAARLESVLAADLGALRQAAAWSNELNHNELASLAAQLTEARRQGPLDAERARREAQQSALRMVRAMAIRQREEVARLNNELTALRVSANAAAASAAGMRRELEQARAAEGSARFTASTVRDQTDEFNSRLAAFRAAAAAHRADLAEKGSEDRQTRIPFRLVRIGDTAAIRQISLRLRRTDARRQRYLLDVTAAGQLLDLGERSVDEAVMIYPARQPRAWELVVEEIGKDEISGYIALPEAAVVASGYSIGRTDTMSFPAR